MRVCHKSRSKLKKKLKEEVKFSHSPFVLACTVILSLFLSLISASNVSSLLEILLGSWKSSHVVYLKKVFCFSLTTQIYGCPWHCCTYNNKNKMVKERIRETNIQPTSSCPLVIGETKYDNRQLSDLRINVKETDVFDVIIWGFFDQICIVTIPHIIS